jgi:hypothetical protein
LEIETGQFLTIKLVKNGGPAKIQLTWYEGSDQYMLRVDDGTWSLDEDTYIISIDNAVLYKKLSARDCKGATENLVELHPWTGLGLTVEMTFTPPFT